MHYVDQKPYFRQPLYVILPLELQTPIVSHSASKRSKNAHDDDDDDLSVSSVSMPEFKDGDSDDVEVTEEEEDLSGLWKFAYDKPDFGRVSPTPGAQTKVFY